MKNYPSVSIIFPTYNGGKEPIECITSIKKLNYPKDKLEIIVVDNGSTDGSLAALRRFKIQDSRFKIIENKINLGFAKGVNLGIKKSHGDYIFIGNDDIVFEKNSLKNLVDYSLNHPGVGILGGKIFFKSHPKKISSSGYMMNKWTGSVYVAPKPNKIKGPDWLQGCALLIPKKVLDELGLLDAEFTHFFEDYDLSIRAKRAGFKIIYLPSAIFWHRESTTANKDKPKKYYHWYRNKFRFILKNMPLANVLSITLVQILLISPYRAVVLRDGRLTPFLKGFSWNIKNLSRTIKARSA